MPGRIVEACEHNWDTHQSDCSGFVRAVCAELGVPIPDTNADGILAHISQLPSGFYALASGPDAADNATAGRLVLGGLRSSNHSPPRAHGHLVIVTGPPFAHDLYPTAYWGTLGAVGRRATTLNYAWREADRDRVLYFARNMN